MRQLAHYRSKTHLTVLAQYSAYCYHLASFATTWGPVSWTYPSEIFPAKVRAKAVTAGGESGDPGSKHFNDQAERYAEGRLREVYFYPDDIKKKAVRVYRPGEVAAPR